jgi:hypothetical protein
MSGILGLTACSVQPNAGTLWPVEFTIVPSTYFTSASIQPYSTLGATIYYTVGTGASMPAIPTTSSEVYSGNNADLYAYGNVSITVSAFATMNSFTTAIATQTFAAASFNLFSYAEPAAPTSFQLNGMSFGIYNSVANEIGFIDYNSGSPNWSCSIDGGTTWVAGVLVSANTYQFAEPVGGPDSVLFKNVSPATPVTSATIYFQVTNITVL